MSLSDLKGNRRQIPWFVLSQIFAWISQVRQVPGATGRSRPRPGSSLDCGRIVRFDLLQHILRRKAVF